MISTPSFRRADGKLVRVTRTHVHVDGQMHRIVARRSEPNGLRVAVTLEGRAVYPAPARRGGRMVWERPRWEPLTRPTPSGR